MRTANSSLPATQIAFVCSKASLFARLSGLSGRIYPVLSKARRTIHRFASANSVRNCAVFFANPRSRRVGTRAAAADRVAARSERAGKVLPQHVAGSNARARTRAAGEAALAHRARLPGTETGTRARAVRGPQFERALITTRACVSLPTDSSLPNASRQ